MNLRKLVIFISGVFTSFFISAQLPAKIADSLDYYVPFKTAYTPAWKKGLCGLINIKGETVLPFQYDFLELVGNEGVAAFKFGSYSFLDFSGKPIFDLTLANYYVANDSLGYGKKSTGDEWYILNFKRRKITVVPDAIDFYNNGEGLFKVNVKGRKGWLIMKPDGSLLLSDPVESFYKAANGRFITKDSTGKYRLYNTTGKQIPLPVSWTEFFPADDSNKIFQYRIKGLTGLSDSQLRPLLPANYQFVTSINSSSLYVLQKGMSFGVANSKGDIILPCNSPNKCRMVNNAQTFFVVESPAYKYGLTDRQNKPVLPTAYENIYLRNTVAAVKDKGGWRFFGLQKRSWLGTEYYEDLHWGIGNYFMVKKKGKWGLLNEEMKVLMPFEYDELNERSYWPGTTQVFQVKKDGKSGILDAYNNTVIPFTYRYIDWSYVSPGCVIAMNDTAYGVINMRNEVVVPFVYSNWEYRHSGEINVFRKGKAGMIDCGGNILIPLEYENIRSFSQDMAAVRINSKWGYINRKAELIIPAVYDDAAFFYKEKAYVKKDGRRFYINNKGEEVKGE